MMGIHLKWLLNQQKLYLLRPSAFLNNTEAEPEQRQVPAAGAAAPSRDAGRAAARRAPRRVTCSSLLHYR